MTRALTENEKAYLKKTLTAEKAAMAGLSWLFSLCFAAISIVVLFLFLQGEAVLSVIVLLLNLLFFWLAGMTRRFKREDLVETEASVVLLSGVFREEVQGSGKRRRVYHYIEGDCIAVPTHWLKRLKVGDRVEAEAFPLGKQSDDAAVFTGKARWSVLAVKDLSSIDSEVTLGLLEAKDSGLPIAGALCSFVVILAMGGLHPRRLLYALLYDGPMFVRPSELLYPGLVGLFLLSFILSILRIAHNKKIFDRIKASSGYGGS